MRGEVKWVSEVKKMRVVVSIQIKALLCYTVMYSSGGRRKAGLQHSGANHRGLSRPAVLKCSGLFYHNWSVDVDVPFKVLLAGFLEGAEGFDVLCLTHSGGHVKSLGVGLLWLVKGLPFAEADKVPFRHHLLPDIFNGLFGDRHMEVYGVLHNSAGT